MVFSTMSSFLVGLFALLASRFGAVLPSEVMVSGRRVRRAWRDELRVLGLRVAQAVERITTMEDARSLEVENLI
jgi:hypothetical protein